MDSFGGLLVVGSLTAVAGFLWAVVWVARENPVLGLLCLFVPLAAVIVLFRHWPQSRKPLAVWGAGLLLLCCGLASSGQPSR